MQYQVIYLLAVVAMVIYLVREFKSDKKAFSALLLCGICCTIRFFILSQYNNCGSLSAIQNTFEKFGALYILPCIYIYLRIQCGVKTFNHNTLILLLLPVAIHFNGYGFDLKSCHMFAIEADQEEYFSLFHQGHFLWRFNMCFVIVMTQSIIFGYRTFRFNKELNEYHFGLTKKLWIYYISLALILMYTILTFYVKENILNTVLGKSGFAITYTMVVTFGFYALPHSFEKRKLVEFQTCNNSCTPVINDNTDVTTVPPPVTPGSKQTEKTISTESFIAKHQNTVQKLKEISETQYLTRGFNSKMAAAQIAVCPSYINEFYKAVYGTCFRDYKNRIQMAKAMELLETTDLTINEIAEQCGYAKDACLNPAFKAHTGMTPSKWREHIKMQKTINE